MTSGSTTLLAPFSRGACSLVRKSLSDPYDGPAAFHAGASRLSACSLDGELKDWDLREAAGSSNGRSFKPTFRSAFRFRPVGRGRPIHSSKESV